MALRTDRLTTLTEAIAGVIEATDVTPHLDPKIRTALGLVRRLGGLDVLAMAKGEAATFLRSLPASAASNPSRADYLASWASSTLAWLDGSTDDPPPPLEL